MAKQPKSDGWVAWKPQWFEAECPKCGSYFKVGDPVFVSEYLGDDHVEAEHAMCPGKPNPFER